MALPYQITCLGPSWASVVGVGNAFTATTGIVLDGSTEKIGFKYYPQTTSPITDVDIRLLLSGTSPTFRAGIFADSSNAPNDASQLGGYTGNFSLGATGWTGLQTLGSNTGALTINTPIWGVIEYVSGTINAGNNIQAQHAANWTAFSNRQLVRHHNGTNWTTTTSQAVGALVVFKHQDGSYAGIPLTAVLARTSQNDIYVNGGTVQTQGVRFKYGAQVKVLGVYYMLTKSGSPNDLVWTVYEGDTSKYTNTETAANVISATASHCYFSSPVLLAADTFLYILATQTGTSDANDYDMSTYTFDPTYISAVAPPDLRFVYGNGTTPSGLTVSTGVEIPFCFPIIADPAADLDMAASGGGTGMILGGSVVH